MTNAYRFLVLTDHRNQTGENSIFPLLSALSKDPRCASLAVASRGVSSNSPFFDGLDERLLYVQSVESEFRYSENGATYTSDLSLIDPRSCDIILMRLPHPVSSNFLLFLDRIFQDKIVINHPKGILKTGTKAYLLEWRDLCPPMKLCKSLEDILDFANRFPIVLKPLMGYGGKDIVRIEGKRVYSSQGEMKLDSYFSEIRSKIESEGMLGMQFLKNVHAGDKRILVVNGKIMGASLRMPAPGSWLCNVAQGGHAVQTGIADEEVALISKIAPTLLKERILMFGADTLMNDEGKRVLSELNTLSIGGFRQIEEQTGHPVLNDTITEIFNYIKLSKNETNPID